MVSNFSASQNFIDSTYRGNWRQVLGSYLDAWRSGSASRHDLSWSWHFRFHAPSIARLSIWRALLWPSSSTPNFLLQTWWQLARVEPRRRKLKVNKRLINWQMILTAFLVSSLAYSTSCFFSSSAAACWAGTYSDSDIFTNNSVCGIIKDFFLWLIIDNLQI